MVPGASSMDIYHLWEMQNLWPQPRPREPESAVLYQDSHVIWEALLFRPGLSLNKASRYPRELRAEVMLSPCASDHASPLRVGFEILRPVSHNLTMMMVKMVMTTLLEHPPCARHWLKSWHVWFLLTFSVLYKVDISTFLLERKTLRLTDVQ